MIFQTTTLKRQGGFTLLEIIITLAIFTIGILGVAAMQLRAIHGNSSGQRLTEASAQAQEIMERILEEPFASYVPEIGQVPPTSFTTGPFTVTRVIAAPPVPSTLTIAQALWVTVNVSWTEPGGNQRNIPLTFIKSMNMETSYEP